MTQEQHIICSKESDIAVIKNNILHVVQKLDSMDNKIDGLASKRELNFHRGLLTIIAGALAWIFQNLFRHV